MHNEELWPMIDGAIIGGLGGLVNGLRQRSPRDWGQLAAAILTAGFAGMLAQLLSGWLGADVWLQFAISGIAGYSGGVLLDDVARRARELVNKGGDILTEKLDAQSRHNNPDDGDEKETSEGEAETYIVVPKWE
ncbi:MAG: hypothetical protein IJU98_03305 [Synergistaceae bacterium]|nr:hypothetical protein [Synergistaceae bacterium]